MKKWLSHYDEVDYFGNIIRYPLPTMLPPDEVFVGPVSYGEAGMVPFFRRLGGGTIAPPTARSFVPAPLNDDDMDAKVPGLLAPIVHDTMDLEAVRMLNPANSSLQHDIDMLQSLEAWKPHLLIPLEEIPHHFRRGTSRRMIKHHARLMHYGVTRTLDREHIRVIANMFTVDKKDLSLRLVCDGRKTNSLMTKPEKMAIPQIHDVIAYLMKNRYACTVDGLSYFYQFPIGEDVGTMFAAHLSGTRGAFQTVCMTRMPMGWSYAPKIAQDVSNALLLDDDGTVLGMAWIDNFIFAGETKEEVSRNFKRFLERCDRCRIQMDNREPSIDSVIEVLGLHCDLASKQYRLEDSWIAKKRSLLARQTMTPRELYEITGACIWHDWVKCIPLCHRARGMDVIRRIASLVTVTGWDTPVSFDASEVQAINEWFSSVLDNPTKHWTAKLAAELDIWTDASDDWWAAVLFCEEEMVAGEHGSFTPDQLKWHIFLKEAFAANRAVQATRGIPRLLHIDNKPLVQAIDRKFSTNKFVNSLLADWDWDNIAVEWVPTTAQRADPYTRGAQLPPVPRLSHFMQGRSKNGQIVSSTI